METISTSETNNNLEFLDSPHLETIKRILRLPLRITDLSYSSEDAITEVINNIDYSQFVQTDPQGFRRELIKAHSITQEDATIQAQKPLRQPLKWMDFERLTTEEIINIKYQIQAITMLQSGFVKALISIYPDKLNPIAKNLAQAEKDIKETYDPAFTKNLNRLTIKVAQISGLLITSADLKLRTILDIGNKVYMSKIK